MRASPSWARRRSRNPLGSLATLVVIAAIAVVAALFWPPPPSIMGQAFAVDGDTLRIGETRIRLVGLDAVEFDQTCTDPQGADWRCGEKAHAFLRDLTRGANTRCAAEGSDRYRRVLARCSIRGADIGEQIIRAGWAVADLEYSVALADGRLNRRGIWAGRFIDPADWRRSRGAEPFDLWSWLMGLVGR
jgi:endonuclease YncB( thermonuclease family)